MDNEADPNAERGVSRRFSVRNESGAGISRVFSLWTVKRAKARAPLLNLGDRSTKAVKSEKKILR